MSYKQVINLATKYANKNQNKLFQEQRKRLEVFYDSYIGKYKSILSEMQGDLFSLKEKGFNSAQWKEMSQFWKELVEIYKTCDDEQPYGCAKQLVHFISDKYNSNLIHRLNTSIQKFLKDNQVDFGKSSIFSQTKVNSLKSIVILASNMELYMSKNPLLPDPREAITLPPPGRENLVIEDPDFIPVGPDMPTSPGLDKTKEAV